MVKKKYVVLALILLLGFSLRLYNLDLNQSGDEAIDISNARKSIGDALKENNYNPIGIISAWEALHPPLYFIVTHYSGAKNLKDSSVLREQLFKLRLPFALLGALSIMVIFKVGETLFNTRTGLLAALFLATSSYHLVYSQIARPYIIFSFLALLSIYFIYQALQKNKVSYWSGFVLSTTLTFYTHYHALSLVFAEIIFMLFIIRNLKHSQLSTTRNIMKNLVVSYAVILTLSSPVILYILKFTFMGSDSSISTSKNTFHYLVYPYLNADSESIKTLTGNLFRISGVLAYYVVQGAVFLPYKIPYLTIPSAIAQLIAFLSFTRPILQYKKEKVILEPYILLLLLISVPTFFVIAAMTYSTIFEPRYYLFVFPFYLVVVSRGLEEINNRAVVAFLAGVIILMNIPATYYWLFIPQHIQ